MEDIKNTSNEGTQTSTEGTQERTFTQEDVNRIVQDRLAKEKGKGNDDLDKRAAELDKRERRMNAIDELRKNDLPSYLVDALNMETDEAFQQSMEAIKKMKGESTNAPDVVIGQGNPIGTVKKGGGDALRDAFGL
ncbi:MAG: hypothetical protein ACI4DR_03555 [Roseburia sp.]